MKVGLATDIVYWHEKLVVVSQQIKNELGTKTCAKVFVTFEKEVSQRKCLKAMTTGEAGAGRAGLEGRGVVGRSLYIFNNDFSMHSHTYSRPAHQLLPIPLVVT